MKAKLKTVPLLKAKVVGKENLKASIKDSVIIEGHTKIYIEDGYIKWKVKGYEEEQTLISLSELKGKDGKDGKSIKGEDGYTPKKGIDYFDGKNGKDGQDAQELELKNDGKNIIWKREKEKDWKQLISLEDIKGKVEQILIGGSSGGNLPAGGTTGQKLVKKSNQDYDTEWVDDSGGGTRGSITGTLSDQTDLQTVLDSKIEVDSTDALRNKTIDDYTNIVHADAIHLRVKATENLSYGDVLKFVGFNNGEQAIEVAKRDNTSVPAIGVLHETLSIGEFGMAISNGLLKGIDTSSYSEGQILYPNTSGGFTATNPGGYAQQLAYVVRSHHINGEIMINVGPVYETDPAGSNTQIQFNNNGVFGASSNLTYNGETLILRGINNDQDALDVFQIKNLAGTNQFTLDNQGNGTIGNFTFTNVNNTMSFEGLPVFSKSGSGLYFGSTGNTLTNIKGSSTELNLRGNGLAINRGLSTATSALDVLGKVATEPVVIFQGVAGQTANLTEWKDTTGNVLGGFTAKGQILANGPSGDIRNFIGGSLAGNTITTGFGNTLIGQNVGKLITSGSYNTIIGQDSGVKITSSSSNTIVGRNNGGNITTGANNTILGVSCMSSNTTGNSNIAIGIVALGSNTTGGANIAIGENALNNNTTGGVNIAIGRDALRSNINGGSNYGIGQNTLYSLSSGSGNFAMGLNAGKYITDGSPLNTANDSFYLGFNARALSDNAQREIVIGSNAIGNGSNTITIGGSTNTKVALNGKIETNSDFETTNIGSGVILKSPNGTRRRITVDNTGVLTTTAL